MKKNFITIFLLIFLISNLIFSENKKLNGNYGIEDGEVYYINRKIEGADAKTFEVFVPENYVEKIVENLQKYNLLTEGFYADVYSTIDGIGHWKTLEGGSPFDGEVGKSSVADEKIMKFRVKREFEELAYYLVKEAHPYETAVINVFRMEV